MLAESASVSVHKFGGAALADASGIRNAVALIAADTGGGRVVVTSAVRGVTDLLIELTRAGGEDAEARVARLAELHERLADALVSESARRRALGEEHAELVAELRARHRALGEGDGPAAALSDAILAFGERAAARLLRAACEEQGVCATVVDAAALIHTDGRHGDAAPELARSEVAIRSTVLPLVHEAVVVVPGFLGRGPAGEVVTLGRGGSDLTATVLARALDARQVTLWKDVPGFMTADPRAVPCARVVPLLDGREAAELAYYGAKVLHSRTLAPLRAGTTLRLRPFGEPTAAGTTIVVGRSVRGAPVRAIAAIADQALVTVSGTGMLGVPGVAARVFRTLAAAGVSVSTISQASSEQSICFTLPDRRTGETAAALEQEFAEEIRRREIDGVSVVRELTTVAVVGSGMAHTPGIAARLFGAVADAGVNVVAIAQGATERNISFVVSAEQGAQAVRAVHAAFHLDKQGGGQVARRRPATDIVLLGVGRVARELLAQIQGVRAREGVALRVVGLVDRSGFLFAPRGLTDRQVDVVLRTKERGGALSAIAGARPGSADAALRYIAGHALSHPVLVDVASGDTSPALLHAAEQGLDLVLANKAPLATELAVARRILQPAAGERRRVLHEATVGAGLPVIDTLRQLVASGDRVEAIDCSPSGTMGFLFSELGRGEPFSEVVRRALALGYTEPDPRDDLSGLDVARKGLILSRMLGYTGGMDDVALESLVPPELAAVGREEFLNALAAHDEVWSRRVREARERGEVIRYRVRVTRRGVRVGLASVPAGTALASLDGTDNLFVFTTARYRDRPLVVAGPGAGTAVTAAGVLGDVLRLAGRA